MLDRNLTKAVTPFDVEHVASLAKALAHPARAELAEWVGLAKRNAVVPMLTEDPVGAVRLRGLVGRSPVIV